MVEIILDPALKVGINNQMFQWSQPHDQVTPKVIIFEVGPTAVQPGEVFHFIPGTYVHLEVIFTYGSGDHWASGGWALTSDSGTLRRVEALWLSTDENELWCFVLKDGASTIQLVLN